MKIRIVGSMKFYDKYEEAKKVLELKGHKVMLPKKDERPLDKIKKRWAMTQFNKDLKWCDAILVMNYTKEEKINHIGVNTLMEIGAADYANKKVYLLFEPPQSCKDELDAIDVKNINGKLEEI